MLSTAATVVHVGAPLTSSSASSSSPSPLLASRLRGREASDSDDDAPFLGSPTSPPPPARVALSARLRRCVSRVTRARTVGSLLSAVSLSGGANWLAKALFICLGMLLLGGVGSLTLHQLMSPQIESLLKQRNQLRVEMDALRNQVANQTRIAESRLEMIHLLEQELEKQVLAAAAAAAAAMTPPPALGGGAGMAARPAMPALATPGALANFWTTLVYATLLGSVVLVVVAVRVYQIARIETQRTQKARASSDMDLSGKGSGHVAVELFGNGPDDVNTLGNPRPSSSSTSSSSSSSAYKRAPVGMTPQDRLVHV